MAQASPIHPHEPSATVTLSPPWLIHDAGGVYVGFEVAHVAEVIVSGRSHPVPGTPDYVLGVTTWRGRVLPLVDLAAALDLTEETDRYAKVNARLPRGEMRIAILQVADLMVGVVADAIHGVMRVAPDATTTSDSAPGRLRSLDPREIERRDEVMYLLDAHRFLANVQPAG